MPNTSRFRHLKFQAPHGMLYTSDGMTEVLDRLVTSLELRFEGVKFSVVRTGRGQFNVVPQPIAHA